MVFRKYKRTRLRLNANTPTETAVSQPVQEEATPSPIVIHSVKSTVVVSHYLRCLEESSRLVGCDEGF